MEKDAVRHRLLGTGNCIHSHDEANATEDKLYGTYDVYPGTCQHCCLGKALSFTVWPLLRRSSLTCDLEEADCKLILDDRTVA